MKYTLDLNEGQVAALEAEAAYRNEYNAERNPDHEEVTVENLVAKEVGALIRGYAEAANGRTITQTTDALKAGDSERVSELVGRPLLAVGD